MGRLYDVMSSQVTQNKSQVEENNNQGEPIYETVVDEDGNEIVIELEKMIVKDKEGN